jgi:Domain of unknown function (DUF1998)
VRRRGHGQVRRSQVITTWGPGSLIDLPRHSGIVAGLESWGRVDTLEEIVDPRVTRKIAGFTGLPLPRLYAPPPESTVPGEPARMIAVYRFPDWFVVQEQQGGNGIGRSRRLVHRKALDENKGTYEGRPVVATRFVRACPRGHISDLPWHWYVHGSDDPCRRQLWLDERGTGGDLTDLTVRCECGERRGLYEASDLALNALGSCPGFRPWLGRDSREECGMPNRLLIRTAANAYFPQVLSALSLPDQRTGVEEAVADLWMFLDVVEDEDDLALMKRKPQVAARLAVFEDADVLEAIRRRREGDADERPVKAVELDALLAAKTGFGDDVPIDPNFHARRLPDSAWRRSRLTADIRWVVQLHRLREVLALLGFTRFEPITPDIDGEYDTDVQRADLADEPSWFPAVENRGEGFFVQLDPEAVAAWLARPTVEERIDELIAGHAQWAAKRTGARDFPGGPYVLLHTLSHLLMQSVAMRCGYPATSIRERIYSDPSGGRYGLLLYTASPDAEGTLGGLVQQARYIEDHLAAALRAGALCSNDPVCSQHSPGEGMEGRWLEGASCHACALVAETSCELRNDYLDRALAVPTLATPEAAFFTAL